MSKNANGMSGGLLSVWKSDIMEVMFYFSGDHLMGVCAKIQGNICYIVNVYSACSMARKRRLWVNLRNLKEDFEEEDRCIVGDFNAVTSRLERSGCSSRFNNVEAREFVSFMDDMELVDVPVLGKKFTCLGSNGRARRLDRI